MNKPASYNQDNKNTALSLIGRIQGIAELMQQVEDDDMKGHIVKSVGYTIEVLTDECWALLDRPLQEVQP